MELSLADYLDLHGRFMREGNSDHHLEIMNISTQLSSRFAAEVFIMTKSGSFFHENKVLEHVAVFDFRFREGRWQCVRFTGIRGDTGVGDGLL